MSNVPGKSDVSPTESETTSTAGNFPHGSRETPVTSVAPMAADRSEKARCRKSDAHVGAWLQSVYRGWCQYYAVPGNYLRLQQFREALVVQWLRVLRRRSQRGRRMTWAKFSQLVRRWLPTPKILHPYRDSPSREQNTSFGLWGVRVGEK
jgi:hypothetical protein